MFVHVSLDGWFNYGDAEAEAEAENLKICSLNLYHLCCCRPKITYSVLICDLRPHIDFVTSKQGVVMLLKFFYFYSLVDHDLLNQNTFRWIFQYYCWMLVAGDQSIWVPSGGNFKEWLWTKAVTNVRGWKRFWVTDNGIVRQLMRCLAFYTTYH